MKSQSYARAALSNPSETAFKKSVASPEKENSPLKRLNSLRKQSRMADQENSQSPLKSFAQNSGPSPRKKVKSKMLQKACTQDPKSLSRFEDSPGKASPLKQFRLFEAQTSPAKSVADLAKSVAPLTSLSVVRQPSLLDSSSGLRPTNLLKSRKTCERK